MSFAALLLPLLPAQAHDHSSFTWAVMLWAQQGWLRNFHYFSTSTGLLMACRRSIVAASEELASLDGSEVRQQERVFLRRLSRSLSRRSMSGVSVAAHALLCLLSLAGRMSPSLGCREHICGTCGNGLSCRSALSTAAHRVACCVSLADTLVACCHLSLYSACLFGTQLQPELVQSTLRTELGGHYTKSFLLCWSAAAMCTQVWAPEPKSSAGEHRLPLRCWQRLLFSASSLTCCGCYMPLSGKQNILSAAASLPCCAATSAVSLVGGSTAARRALADIRLARGIVAAAGWHR